MGEAYGILSRCRRGGRTKGNDMEHLSFPNESAEYRSARIALLDAEIALRRQIEAVAAQRRALPPGGDVPEDYNFESSGAYQRPERVKLFEPLQGKPDVILPTFMSGPHRHN